MRMAATLAALVAVGISVGAGAMGTGPAPRVAHLDRSSPSAAAQPGREWLQTGSMRDARVEHSAVLLHSGQVLVIGGRNGNITLSSAELYEPSSGQWTLTGSMATGRVGHTTTLLPDGRVVVTGGRGLTGYFGSVEIYDPTAGTWSSGAPMLTARAYHTATLLADGTVLVAGGQAGGEPFSSAERYSPSLDLWSPVASMRQDRSSHTAVRLPDGSVLVAGGYRTPDPNAQWPIPGDNVTGSAERFIPTTGAWVSAGGITPRAEHSVVTLPDGDEIFIGGNPGTRYSHYKNFVSAINGYTPSSDTWYVAAGTRESYGEAAAVLSNGVVLMAGGEKIGCHGYCAELTAEAYIYYPDFRSCTSTVPMSQPRHAATATTLPSVGVLVAGGIGSTGALASAEIYVDRQIPARLTLSGLYASYDGGPKAPTVVTTPPGLSTLIEYFNGAEWTNAAPSAPGQFGVRVTIVDSRYEGFASATLMIFRSVANGGGFSSNYANGVLTFSGMTFYRRNGKVTFPDCSVYIVMDSGQLIPAGVVEGCISPFESGGSSSGSGSSGGSGAGTFAGPRTGGAATGSVNGGILTYGGATYTLVNGKVTFPDCTVYIAMDNGILIPAGTASGCTPSSGSSSGSGSGSGGGSGSSSGGSSSSSSGSGSSGGSSGSSSGGAFAGPRTGGPATGSVSGGFLTYGGATYALVNGKVTFPDCTVYIALDNGMLIAAGTVSGCTPSGGSSSSSGSGSSGGTGSSSGGSSSSSSGSSSSGGSSGSSSGGAFAGPRTGGPATGSVSGGILTYGGATYALVNGRVTFPDCTIYIALDNGMLIAAGTASGCTAIGGSSSGVASSSSGSGPALESLRLFPRR